MKPVWMIVCFSLLYIDVLNSTVESLSSLLSVIFYPSQSVNEKYLRRYAIVCELHVFLSLRVFMFL